MKIILGIAVAISVGLYVISALVPDAITDITDANTTGWDTAVASLFDQIPLMATLAILLVIVGVALSSFSRAS